MTTFGYAERPTGLTGPTQRTPVNERLEHDAARAPRGEGARRVRNRSHHNETPPRPAVPGGNVKPAAGRLGAPSRPTMPAQGRRTGDTPATADPSAGETAILPAVPAADTAVLPKVPADPAPATGYPSRPDPSDPATEVWALVERAQAGEAEAFGLIYDRYVDTVFRFVYFRVGNRQLAEDLTSDTFLRALKRIGSFTWQGRDLGAWLVTIARNLVADHFKSGRYRLEVTTGDVLDADREDRGPEGSPEAAVVEHITNVALLTAVKQLNPEQQECIVLRFLQGFSVAETARAMGKNEGAIKALQYRAVRALARLLPDGFQP
ncbi:sigma-70 family RNA polymerase sigma factor [Micromonospora sp. DR5-3]|uniref:ECF subfamily RNA polymerase sigma factor, BldN family n=1 Tax=unclassified Micromonospora TaxID=2617518 RepID=UPI0011D33F1C|nr:MULTISPECIES: ECF subfamily RNA polymerase sigma factor, BldN family [unclassified Micromonospora]MCW3812903.1 sigma-70 family RNA polymerase sigma factor [Micromonospora sp. DR5-3]TYC26091.1 sigma-70 family RNA polymerase sigma factor [Micromonospora sp. MP36]